MFGDVVSPSVRVGSKQGYTVTVSIIVHTVLFAALVIIPLMAYDVLPTPPNMINAFVAAPPPPPPPPQAAIAPKTPPPDVNPAAAPVEAPKEIKPETGLETAQKGVVGG